MNNVNNYVMLTISMFLDFQVKAHLAEEFFIPLEGK